MGEPIVHIQMLGTMTVSLDDVRIDEPDFGSRKARELLRWLADARNEVVTDDTLVHALWPELPIESALRSLRVRVSELRKLLRLDKEKHLRRMGEGYILRTSPERVRVDVDEFTTLAAAALKESDRQKAVLQLTESIGLYKGEYLADDPETIQWQSTRERCRALFLKVSITLADMYEQSRQYESGIQLMQRLLNRPDREEDHFRRLMRLQYLNNDQIGALRTFHQCREYLDSELGVRPMPATMQVFERVLRQESLPTEAPEDGNPLVFSRPPIDTSPHFKIPFLGRQAELSQIMSQLQSATDGRSTLSWIYGAPGMGKTRLLVEALHKFGEKGSLRTLWIRGDYLNARIPYSAILESIQVGMLPELSPDELDALMVPRLPTLQRLLGMPQGGSVDGPGPSNEKMDDEGNVWLRQDLLAFFARLAEQKPLICCIEDVEALDAASQSLVFALAKRLHVWPLSFIMTSHQEPKKCDLGRGLMEQDEEAIAVGLTPLPFSDLSPLIGRGIPSVWAERWLRRLHAESRGEPFALCDRLYALKDQGKIDFQDGTVVFKSSLLTLMTDDATSVSSKHHRDENMMRRMLELGEGERTLLYKAAVLDGSLTLARLQLIHPMGDGDFHMAVERLIQARFLRVESENAGAAPKLVFPHSQLQRFVYDYVPRSERMWYHHMAFGTLKAEISREANTDCDYDMKRVRLLTEAAYHALLSGVWPEAAAWALRAAAAAEDISPGLEVVSLCRQAYRAAQHLDPTHPLYEEATRALAEALYSVGGFEEALPLYEAIVSEYDDVSECIGEVRRLITIYLQLNKMDAASAWSNRLLNQSGKCDVGRGRALGTRARVDYRSGDVANAIARGNEAISLFEHLNEPERSATAYQQLALVFWDLGQYDNALAYTEESLKRYRRVDSPGLVSALNQLGELYQDLLCVPSAMQLHRQALDMALEQRHIVMSAEIWRNLGMNYLYEGRIEKGMNTLYQSWQQVNDLDLGAFRREVHLRSLIEAHILCDDASTARRLLDEYKSVTGPREDPFRYIFEGALHVMEEGLDEAEVILRRVFQFWEHTGRRGRAFHVLNFITKTFMRRGLAEKARTYGVLALDEMERVQKLLPANLALEMRNSHQYTAVQKIIDVLDGPVELFETS